MGLSINTNIAGMGAHRSINKSSGLLGRALEKMSSGLRINRAADDAAGLAIAGHFTSGIREAQTESRGIQSGINAARTAEGGLEVQQQAVQRIRDLAVQASNGTLSDDNRAALNQEVQQLREQIESVSQDTEFNGQQLLDQDRTIDVNAQGSLSLEISGSTNADLGLDTTDISTAQGAQDAIAAADAALQSISTNRANLGAQSNRFESAIETRQVRAENETAARSAILDADMAKVTMERTRNQILLQSGMSALMQSNVTNQNALSLLGG